jgi:hypothetical protein
MKTVTFSHNDADLAVSKKVRQGVLNALHDFETEVKPASANLIRTEILKRLKSVGWSDKFRLDAQSQISLTASMNSHVMCFQTGNMSRFYADLLKLQYVYAQGNAVAAIYLIFSKDAAKILGSNLAHYDRLVRELLLFREIITVPILVIGIS